MKKKIPAKSNCRLALAKLECKLKQQQRQWVNGKKVKKLNSFSRRSRFFSTLFNIYTQQRVKSFSSIVVFHAIFDIFCSNLLSLLYFPHNFFGVVMFYCAFFVDFFVFFLYIFLCVFWCFFFLFNLTLLARYCCFCCCRSINTSRTRHEGRERELPER